MKDFNFKIPQNIQFGMGILKKLPEILKEDKSNHVFLVSDRGLEKIGVVDKVKNIIEASGIKCTTYLDVVPNPTITVVNEATNLYKKCGATSLIALGGGSPLDVSKAVGVLSTFGGEITQYEGLNRVPGPIVPIIAIPTTAGTGSEVTASSVITDETRNYKFSIVSYETLPKYALLDPELITTAPASIAAACGVDALIHAIEAYLSKQASPFSDAMAEKAMELIGKNLRNFIKDRRNEEAAAGMML
ncbi:iron-containing alcohol dehydrogenase, partial [Cetobacterium sp.]